MLGIRGFIITKGSGNSAKKHKEGPLEEKWRSYTGTGYTATKGKNALALREAVGGGQFAVVKLYGGLWTNSRLEVIEEIATADLKVGLKRFRAIAKKLGFKTRPQRLPTITLGLHKH